MNEFLNGLIGAELTLLGVPSQAAGAAPEQVPAAPLPRDGETAAGATAQGQEDCVDSNGKPAFSQRHYRIAAG